MAICSDIHESIPARRSTSAHTPVVKPGVLVRITCSNSECRHRRNPTIPGNCSLLLLSYRIHLSPGSRRSGNTLLNQSRISAQSRKTVTLSSSVPSVVQSAPPIVEVPFTIIDGPPVIHIPPATPSDQSMSPPNTPPPLVPADPQIALQHLQHQHDHNGNPPANTDVNANVQAWQPADPGFPVRPLSSSSLSSSDSPSELINTPTNFPCELGGFPNQISIATDDQLTQPGGVHDSWLLGNNSFATFTDGFTKDVTVLSPMSTNNFVDFPHRFPDITMPSNFYPTPLSTSAQFFPPQPQEPETPAQLHMRTFKSHAPSPHDTFPGYSECYVNQISTLSNSLPSMPFPGNSPPGVAATWNHVRNDFASTNWSCSNQQRSWA